MKNNTIFKKQVTTVSDAIAPIQQTLTNLKQVVEIRDEAATQKQLEIEALELSKKNDEEEFIKANRILSKLEELFN